jgi:protein DEK
MMCFCPFQKVFLPHPQANTRKKAILDFSGFAFNDEAEGRELEARKLSLGKWKLDLIHKLLDTLDLPRGAGDKAAKLDKIMDFLMEPKALSETNLAEKERAKREKEKAKREREKAKKEKEKAKKEKGQAKRKAAEQKKGSAKKVRVVVDGWMDGCAVRAAAALVV